ncbi:hypothetical protein [Bdellovibrio sp. HCB-162]|uniref:hypothetical protein n=1 Tax=Bdellovibrio sp. HCB-162 TaxID=3394234 RepID=UPI0039BD8118
MKKRKGMLICFLVILGIPAAFWFDYFVSGCVTSFLNAEKTCGEEAKKMAINFTLVFGILLMFSISAIPKMKNSKKEHK